MPEWSIKIIPAKTGAGTAFQPNLQGSQPGDPLQAQQDDTVSWNNTTAETHQPWQTDSNYKLLPEAWVYANPYLYLSDPVPPRSSSSPGYNVTQPPMFIPPPNDDPPTFIGPPPPSKPKSWTIYYACKKHPNRTTEQGRIVATVIPTVK